MTKIIISIVLLIVGIGLGFVSFNHISPWLGLLITIFTIGVFLNYIYKQIKNKTNEKK
jgi:flagellar biosynthesis protein FliP